MIFRDIVKSRKTVSFNDRGQCNESLYFFALAFTDISVDSSSWQSLILPTATLFY